ncbi:MAG: hypothetical protein Q9M15_02755 [Mariprofundaceae bacterium]|nr:hypothetical protein [Mariprofundaceae bacterium]
MLKYMVWWAVLLGSFSNIAMAKTLPFQLSIQGADVSIQQTFTLRDVNEGNHVIHLNFQDHHHHDYTLDVSYQALPSNRSYPMHLDVTLKNKQGKKLAYLFFANNGLAALKRIGTLGVAVNINGKLMDIRLRFDEKKQGTLALSDVNHERFIQDTLVPAFHFQMIRPVIVPWVAKGLRSQTYSLDAHPYAVNYSIQDLGHGVLEFQHHLYRSEDGKKTLLERVYFYADSLSILREAMYAAKYFDRKNGTFKLVFYPALGQTEPPKIR